MKFSDLKIGDKLLTDAADSDSTEDAIMTITKISGFSFCNSVFTLLDDAGIKHKRTGYAVRNPETKQFFC
jgi:hypothetical protein